MNRIILPFLFLVSCSCAVRSLHPAISEGGSGADPAMLLGSWEITEVIDQVLAALPVIGVVVGKPGELILSMRSGTQTVTRQGRLADLDGMIVLSIQTTASTWNHSCPRQRLAPS